jgi:hypothetical protein
MTGRCVAQIRNFMLAVERIDQGRQAGQFARKSSQHNATAVLVHQRGERLARIARRTIALEHHFVAVRLKALDPADERRGTVEKCRFVEHANECHRQTDPARMIQNHSAIFERATDLGNRKQPRLRQIFLLHIDKHDNRNAG